MNVEKYFPGYGVAVGPGAVPYARAVVAERKARKLKRRPDLDKPKKTVTKAFMGGGNYRLGNELAIVAAKPLPQAHAAGLGLGGASQLPVLNRDERKKKRNDKILGAAAGSAAGTLAYTQAGYAGKYYNRIKNDPKIYGDPITHRAVRDKDGNIVKPAYNKPEYKRAMEGTKSVPGHKKKYGFTHGDPKLQDKKGYTRNYPKELPGNKIVRTLGYTHHGKTGLALGAVASAAGGVLGAKAAGARYDLKRKKENEKVKAKSPRKVEKMYDDFIGSDAVEFAKYGSFTRLAAGAKRGWQNTAAGAWPVGGKPKVSPQRKGAFGVGQKVGAGTAGATLAAGSAATKSGQWIRNNPGKTAAAVGGTAAGVGGAAYLTRDKKNFGKSLGESAFGVDHGEFSKAEKKQPKASVGRQTLGTLVPGYHGAFAGKKGHKTKAALNEWVPSMAGAVGGTLAGAGGAIATRGRGGSDLWAPSVGGAVGSAGGALYGTRRAQRKGHYKKESRG